MFGTNLRKTLKSESVILSLAYNVTACPWPALASMLTLMLAVLALHGGTKTGQRRPGLQPRLATTVLYSPVAYLTEGREGTAKTPGETPGMG